MKSYTDITQSKKLVEILPKESADQTWEIIAIAGANLGVPEEMQYWHNGNTPCILNSKIGIPCWSLSALLDYLAKKDCFPEITYTSTYYLMDVNFYDDEEGKTVHPIHFIRTEGESLIDTCVEMIIRLKEDNLI